MNYSCIFCVSFPSPSPLSLLSFHPSKPSPSVLFLILLYLPLWHYIEYGIHCSIRKCGYVSNLDKVLFSITTIAMFHCTTSLMAHVRCYITRKTSWCFLCPEMSFRPTCNVSFRCQNERVHFMWLDEQDLFDLGFFFWLLDFLYPCQKCRNLTDPIQGQLKIRSHLFFLSTCSIYAF